MPLLSTLRTTLTQGLRLGLGCAPIAGLYQAVSNEKAIKTIQTAYEAGIRYFDTATYGRGLSEERLGEALKGYPRNTYVLSSKLGRRILGNSPAFERDPHFPEAPSDRKIVFDYSYDGILGAAEDSIARLGGLVPDIFFVHDLGRATHGSRHQEMLSQFLYQGGLSAICELKEQGRAIGLGVNEPGIVLELLRRKVPLDILLLAGRFTVLDQTALQQGVLAACHERDIFYLAAAPFNSGLAAGCSVHPRFNYETPSKEMVHKAQQIAEMAKARHISLPQLALQYPLLNPRVGMVLAGMRTSEEVHCNVQAMTATVPFDFWQELVKEGLIPEVEAPYSKPRFPFRDAESRTSRGAAPESESVVLK